MPTGNVWVLGNEILKVERKTSTKSSQGQTGSSSEKEMVLVDRI